MPLDTLRVFSLKKKNCKEKCGTVTDRNQKIRLVKFNKTDIKQLCFGTLQLLYKTSIALLLWIINL